MGWRHRGTVGVERELRDPDRASRVAARIGNSTECRCSVSQQLDIDTAYDTAEVSLVVLVDCLCHTGHGGQPLDLGYRKAVPVLVLGVAHAIVTLCSEPATDGDTDAVCTLLSLLHARVRAATLTMITAAVLRRSLGDGFTEVANWPGKPGREGEMAEPHEPTERRLGLSTPTPRNMLRPGLGPQQTCSELQLRIF